MKTFITIIALSITLFSTTVQSQTVTVTGNVFNTVGNPIPGANIVLKNTTTGTISDINGAFSISCIPGKDTLLISYIGCMQEKIAIGSSTHLEIFLTEDIVKLEEVVVTGYATRSKRSMTSAISGRVPGLSITSSRHSSDIPVQHVTRYGGPEVGAGILTAGELNDFSKWNLWKDISKNELKAYRKIWEFRPLDRYTLQFQSETGKPIADALVKLKQNTNIIWEARTDNTGKAELWSDVFADSVSEKSGLYIEVSYKGNTYKLKKATTFQKGINILKAPVVCDIPGNLDIAFIVDATGSMQDEINYLKAELNDIVGKIKDTLPILNINLASVFYRDHGDEYITKISSFSNDIAQTVNFIKENNADGGGDAPEAVDKALLAALNDLKWSESAICRIAFLILDAPPHQTPEVIESLKKTIQAYAAKGIKLVPITCSGIDKGTEYLMRSFSLLTNGTYVFLTDHSGVGDEHIKPTTDTYDVELLNKLLQKIILQNTYTPGCEIQTEIVTSDTINVIYPEKMNEVSDSVSNVNLEKLSTTSTETIKTRQRIKIFPNPTYGNITLEIRGEIGEIFISDLRGKILERLEVNHQERVGMDLSRYPTGVYLVRYEYKPDHWMDGKVMLLH